MRVRWVPTSPPITSVTAETPAPYVQECPVRLPARRCRRVHIAVVAIAVLAAIAVVTFPAIARAGAQGAENGAAAGAGDVRGTRDGGSWTEWVPASTEEPAVFDAAVTSVQTRVLLRGGDGGASPRVRSVRLSAHTIAQTLAAVPLSTRSYRVFATREGLVGGTTANGHVILE